jgi:hypothetical protein
MKKIAILVGGMYREFEHAHKSWSFLKCKNSDVYISTWDYTIDVVTQLSIDTKREIDKSDVTKFLPNANIKILSEEEVNLENTINKIIYHWKSLLNMVYDSKNKYEFAILTRPDFYIKENMDLYDFICNINDNKIYTLNEVCVLPNYPFVSVNDCFFVAKFDEIEKMISYLTLNSEYYDTHIYLSKYFIEKKINIQSISPYVFEYYVFRSIHRYTKNLSFDENKKIGIEWWNVKNNVGEISEDLIEKLKIIYGENI